MIKKLHNAAASLSDAEYDLLRVRGQKARVKKLRELWWQVMDDAREELLKQADKALGHDRTL